MEKWDLLDAQGNPTGRTIVRGERLQAGQYHLVVHIWVVDSAGRLLIQKRAPHLRLMPNTWAATGGSAVSGEDSPTAARRELAEELGIYTYPNELRYLGRLRRRNSHCDLWMLRADVPVESLHLQKEEVARAMWVTWERLMDMVRRRNFHNYGRTYFRWLFQHIYGEAGCGGVDHMADKTNRKESGGAGR